MLSGFVYNMAYFSDNIKLHSSKTNRYKNQVIRLIYLYFLWGVIQGVIRIFFNQYSNSSGSWMDIMMLPIKFTPPYWYLYVLVVFYLVFMLTRNVSPRIIFPVLIVLAIVQKMIFSNVLGYTNVYQIMYNALFFYIGIIIKRYQKNIKKYQKAFIIVTAVLLVMTVDFDTLYIDDMISSVPVVSIVSALGVCWILWLLFLKIKFTDKSMLARIGNASLEIYLTHCFFTAGNRTLFARLGVTNLLVSVLLNLVLSIAASLIVAEISKKIHLYDVFFSGKLVTRQFSKDTSSD